MAETRTQERAPQLQEGLTHGRDGWEPSEAMMIIVADTQAGDTGDREVRLPRDTAMRFVCSCAQA